MSYTIESKYTTRGAFTTARAQSYYGRARTVDEVVYHWWNTPDKRAKSPDNIYGYMINNNKSVNYIAGWDDHLGKPRLLGFTPLVGYVAVTTQNANIFSLSVETDPLITTSDPRSYELYKMLGWLHDQLEKRYKKPLRIGVHKQYWQTSCSPIDKARIRREADKWKNGAYNPAKPQPPVEGAVISYERFDDAPRLYKFKRDSYMYNFNHKKHADMEKVLSFKKGDTIALVGEAHNKTVNSKYLLTEYSFGATIKNPSQVKATNGFNVVDVELVVPDNPIAQEPKIVRREVFEPAKPMELLVNTKLVEIPSSTIVVKSKEHSAGELINDIAETTWWDNGSSFHRTTYSVSNNINRGFKADALKDIQIIPQPPVVDPPEEPLPDLPPSEDSYGKQNNELLKKLIGMITELIEKIKNIF